VTELALTIKRQVCQIAASEAAVEVGFCLTVPGQCCTMTTVVVPPRVFGSQSNPQRELQSLLVRFRAYIMGQAGYVKPSRHWSDSTTLFCPPRNLTESRPPQTPPADLTTQFDPDCPDFDQAKRRMTASSSG